MLNPEVTYFPLCSPTNHARSTLSPADGDVDADADSDAALTCDDTNCADGVHVIGQPLFRDCCCEGVCCECDYGIPPEGSLGQGRLLSIVC